MQIVPGNYKTVQVNLVCSHSVTLLEVIISQAVISNKLGYLVQALGHYSLQIIVNSQLNHHSHHYLVNQHNLKLNLTHSYSSNLNPVAASSTQTKTVANHYLVNLRMLHQQ